MIQAVAFGKRFVAVGNGIFSIDSSQTVPEFLWEYLRYIFGSGWLANEKRKSGYQRHLVTQWFQHADDMAQREPADVHWFEEVDGTAKLIAKNFGSPFDLVVLTNIPHRYAGPGALDPKKDYLAWIPSDLSPHSGDIHSLGSQFGSHSTEWFSVAV